MLGILRQSDRPWFRSLQPYLLGLGCAGAVWLLRLGGFLQGIELRSYDWMMRHLPPGATEDRIVLVGIDEQDLQQIGTALVSDQVMAELLQRILAHQPRVVGLDFYRNLPIAPGQAALAKVLRDSPNLIGIEKVVGDERLGRVPGHPVLVAAGRVAASDIVVDPDGRVRRGLLYPSLDGEEPLPSLGLRLAHDYLAAEGLLPDPAASVLSYGSVAFMPFQSHQGGYVRADDGGYQLLLRMKRPGSFRYVSMTEVLEGRISSDLMRDRIVMIGSTTAVDGDIFFTAFSDMLVKPNQQQRYLTSYGLEIHAMLATQIIRAVKDGYPAGIFTLGKGIELLMIGGMAGLGVWVNLREQSLALRVGGWVLVSGVVLGGGLGLLMRLGLWVPVMPLVLSYGSAMLAVTYHRIYQFKVLLDRDELTQIANRRALNLALQQEWTRGMRTGQPVSLILCDVDFFKRYNDTYGHPQGDVCLRAVAQALQKSVSSAKHVVARYGGEEFVILMPSTPTSKAIAIAESARHYLRQMALEHKASEVSDRVSLSLGVATLVPNPEQFPNVLVEAADANLYRAKQQGRDRVVAGLD